MPEIIPITVYRFDELSEKAKDKARCWYRETGFDYDWFDCTYEDFQRVCEILGVDLRTRAVPLYGGRTRQEPVIYFTGFWSQGDGACFEGSYGYVTGAHRRIREYAPQDPDLHRIADTLRDVQRRYFYQLRADARHSGRYYHEYCMTISVERDHAARSDVGDKAEEMIVEALRDLARWLYRSLRSEYDYLTSDEAVEQAIAANDYLFCESGRRFRGC
ncbi:antitoxin of toxin-antitoxin stability system [Sphingobium sp. H39-3-25]|uniref:antitoxin of toxin-antitoxin stability system n=1 Tax=Sphingomonadales TaxID=204457 RepID=UPI00082E77F9|nr:MULTISPECIES: antitoxin of toxin-antitoxin stability system [Sphingomonadaceae]MDF0491562.1 antitoxin of toxin-antitoxin stability system [Sphingomonas pollutisoli]MDF0544003.1 antitoxin of toxin-antitoxin stability system [Sphingobium arseniciresistens]